MSEPNYEFSSEQNRLVGKVAKRMNFVGWAFILLGFFLLIKCIFKYYLDIFILIGILNVLIGISTTKAARSFKLIVDTEGNDINHLMDAFLSFHKIYNIQFWAIIFVIILLIIFFIIISGFALINNS